MSTNSRTSALGVRRKRQPAGYTCTWRSHWLKYDKSASKSYNNLRILFISYVNRTKVHEKNEKMQKKHTKCKRERKNKQTNKRRNIQKTPHTVQFTIDCTSELGNQQVYYIRCSLQTARAAVLWQRIIILTLDNVFPWEAYWQRRPSQIDGSQLHERWSGGETG